jgi:hypothetical protein
LLFLPLPHSSTLSLPISPFQENFRENIHFKFLDGIYDDDYIKGVRWSGTVVRMAETADKITVLGRKRRMTLHIDTKFLNNLIYPGTLHKSVYQTARNNILRRSYCYYLPSSGCYFRIPNVKPNLKVGCLHPVACTRSGSGFPSNATPPEDGHKTETCNGY